MTRRTDILDHLDTLVGYEIYPYSFYDSDGDGYGDLEGIRIKLPYLQALGVNLVWLCPVYASPLADYGYDVSDYYQVNPRLGTNEQLKRLIDEFHQAGIYVILDFVLNHVSRQHEWFRQACSDRNSPYHDYFIFRGSQASGVPNNWMGYFSQSVWSYVPQIDQYYLHIFSDQMPDLNWENPRLRQEIYRAARYYLEMGADGFRLDAIAHLAKDRSFRSSSRPADERGLVLDSRKFANRPKVFSYLAEFKREVLQPYGALSIGEVGGEASTEMAVRYADKKTGSLTMVFNFDTCWENSAYGSLEKSDDQIKTDVVNLKRLFAKWYRGCHGRCEMPVYWLNHDHPRLVSQYGSLAWRRQSAKMLGLVLMTLYGLPFVYQGEEMALSNAEYDDVRDFFVDVDAYNFYLAHRAESPEKLLRFFRRSSRVNARVPLSWSDAPQAGFTTGTPYLKVNPNYRQVNAARQMDDPDSVWNFYRRLIQLRKQYGDLIYHGSFRLYCPQDPDLFVYRRSRRGQCLLVIANFSARPRRYRLPAGFHLLIGAQPVGWEDGRLAVGPYGAYVFGSDGV
jgi:glycosidase